MVSQGSSPSRDFGSHEGKPAELVWAVADGTQTEIEVTVQAKPYGLLTRTVGTKRTIRP
jgi:hypothetical protein